MSAWSRLWRKITRRSPADEESPEWSAVTARARADMDSRRAAVEPMADVVAEISAALFDADPIGLAAKDNGDEYDPEAETIVLRLADERRLLSDDDVLEIVHEEFVRWFGDDVAGGPARYEDLAGRVSAIWRDYLASGA